MLNYATIIVNWVVDHKDPLLALVGGGTGLSIMAQGLLHKLGTSSKAFAYTLVQLLTVLAALSAYLVANTNFLEAYPLLATAVAAIHRYMVSPYYTNKVLPYLEFQASREQAVVTPAAPSLATQVTETPVAEASPVFE